MHCNVANIFTIFKLQGIALKYEEEFKLALESFAQASALVSILQPPPCTLRTKEGTSCIFGPDIGWEGPTTVGDEALLLEWTGPHPAEKTSTITPTQKEESLKPLNQFLLTFNLFEELHNVISNIFKKYL